MFHLTCVHITYLIVPFVLELVVLCHVVQGGHSCARQLKINHYCLRQRDH